MYGGFWLNSQLLYGVYSDFANVFFFYLKLSFSTDLKIWFIPEIFHAFKQKQNKINIAWSKQGFVGLWVGLQSTHWQKWPGHYLLGWEIITNKKFEILRHYLTIYSIIYITDLSKYKIPFSVANLIVFSRKKVLLAPQDIREYHRNHLQGNTPDTGCWCSNFVQHRSTYQKHTRLGIAIFSLLTYFPMPQCNKKAPYYRFNPFS